MLMPNSMGATVLVAKSRLSKEKIKTDGLHKLSSLNRKPANKQKHQLEHSPDHPTTRGTGRTVQYGKQTGRKF